MRFLLEQPELLGALGIAEQFGYRRHNAHLDDVAVAKMKRGFAAWRDYLDNLKSYDVAAPNARPATFHRVLKGLIQSQLDGALSLPRILACRRAKSDAGFPDEHAPHQRSPR